MNANIMCEYTRDEWTHGFVKMGVDSIGKLRKKLPELRAELRDATKWQDIYNYAFSFAREVGASAFNIFAAAMPNATLHDCDEQVLKPSHCVVPLLCVSIIKSLPYAVWCLR